MIEQPAILSSLLSVGMGLLFFVTLLVFTLYSTFLAYHWYAYGTKKATATLILAIYLLGSAPFFLIMAALL